MLQPSNGDLSGKIGSRSIGQGGHPHDDRFGLGQMCRECAIARLEVRDSINTSNDHKSKNLPPRLSPEPEACVAPRQWEKILTETETTSMAMTGKRQWTMLSEPPMSRFL